MDWSFFFEVLIGGLLAGVMYSLVALGFVLLSMKYVEIAWRTLSGSPFGASSFGRWSRLAMRIAAS